MSEPGNFTSPGVETAQAISPDSGTHWSEPGAWRAAPGVLRIPLPLPMDGLKAINVYAIEHADGLTCIDAGWAIEASRQQFESSLRQAGYQFGDIRRFLVTHVHRDHYTQAVTLRREFGCEVSLGAAERSTLQMIRSTDPDLEDPHLRYLAESGARELGEQWARFSQAMAPDLEQWGDPDLWLGGDHTIDLGDLRLDAVSTPGHTKGHFVFNNPEAGILFAGDHVLPTITPSIGVEPVLAAQPLGDYLESLAKVRALADARLFPAHGPVAPSVHARVDELVEHHRHRLALCVQAVAAGHDDANLVAGDLPWTRHNRSLSDLHLFDTVLAILETRAHLELLVARGDLERVVDDGIFRYSLPAVEG